MLRNALCGEDDLLRVKNNDKSFNSLRLGTTDPLYDGNLSSEQYGGPLGKFIAINTHLSMLDINLYNFPNGEELVITDQEFYNGLKRNSSIQQLYLTGNSVNQDNTLGNVGCGILTAYRENSTNLTELTIGSIDIRSDVVLVKTTIKNCTNLSKICLQRCSINDHVLPQIIQAFRGLNHLNCLYLGENNIGNRGCEAIAQFLADPNNNVSSLGLSSSNIGNEGAVAIINSLQGNNQLHTLFLFGNPIDGYISDVASELLCNKASINSIHSSNHTLRELTLPNHSTSTQLNSLLKLNEKADKEDVAIEKILQCHRNIDMKPFYDLDSRGEWSLKGLPLAVAWFDKASDSVERSRGESYGVDQKKLSSIYQFAHSMPLSFPPERWKATESITMLFWIKDAECRELKKEKELKDIECQELKKENKELKKENKNLRNKVPPKNDEELKMNLAQ